MARMLRLVAHALVLQQVTCLPVLPTHTDTLDSKEGTAPIVHRQFLEAKAPSERNNTRLQLLQKNTLKTSAGASISMSRLAGAVLVVLLCVGIAMIWMSEQKSQDSDDDGKKGHPEATESEANEIAYWQEEISRALILASVTVFFNRTLSICMILATILSNCMIMAGHDVGLTLHTISLFAAVNTVIKGIESAFQFDSVVKAHVLAKRSLMKLDRDLKQLLAAPEPPTQAEMDAFKSEFNRVMADVAEHTA